MATCRECFRDGTAARAAKVHIEHGGVEHVRVHQLQGLAIYAAVFTEM
jgi:hypothetical protein